MVLIFLGVICKAVNILNILFKTKIGKKQLLCSFINLYATPESYVVNAFEKEAAHAAAAAAGDLWV